MVVENVVVEEEVNEGDAAEPKENEVMEEAKEKTEEEEKKAAEGQVDKEVDIPVDVDTTPIQTVPPTIDDATTTPGKPKPSKKRKTRSRK